MSIHELRNITKFFFGYEELGRCLGISQASARVMASRYTKIGALVRIKRNLYMLRTTWDFAGREDKFRIANLAQTPSYISFMTALEHHDITSQMQRDVFESAAVQRTKTVSMAGADFRYYKLSSDLYFGFEKQGNFFIAKPEKAFMDALYLVSLGRYALDFSSMDWKRFNWPEIETLSKAYPRRTLNFLQAHGYLQTA